MSISQPRLRSMLRQADKVAANGKRSAAEDLYRQITEEAPESAAGWAGLAGVLLDPAEREQAYEKALALDPKNKAALVGLAELRGEPIPEFPEEVVEEPEPEPVDEHDHGYTAVTPDEDEEEEAHIYYCYRHPNRETSLRCYTCGKPICIDCARKTSVGYSCPDCQRELQDKYFNATNTDYIIAAVLAVVLGVIGGVVIGFIGALTGFLFWIIMFFVGGAAGSFIGGVLKRAIGRRRGRYLPMIVAVIMVITTILPVLTLGGGFIGMIIYLVTAVPAVYYQMR
ncbi:MAG TPA: hypothetical protein EYP41_11570 [Anaerolineae bacterium]|nr:hypothetical protein [Anaerolineae bacterium]HIP70489.1 hypothetical protein [Anaerolineae bacterium]